MWREILENWCNKQFSGLSPAKALSFFDSACPFLVLSRFHTPFVPWSGQDICKWHWRSWKEVEEAIKNSGNWFQVESSLLFLENMRKSCFLRHVESFGFFAFVEIKNHTKYFHSFAWLKGHQKGMKSKVSLFAVETRHSPVMNCGKFLLFRLVLTATKDTKIKADCLAGIKDLSLMNDFWFNFHSILQQKKPLIALKLDAFCNFLVPSGSIQWNSRLRLRFSNAFCLFQETQN